MAAVTSFGQAADDTFERDVLVPDRIGGAGVRLSDEFGE